MSLLFLLKPHRSHHRSLLSTSFKLLEDGHNGSALIAAWTACEVLVESVCGREFQMKGSKAFEEAVTDFIPSYSFTNGRIRNLYTALTGHEIHKESFWPDLLEAGKIRHNVVHSGKSISYEQAKYSIHKIEEGINSVETFMKNRALKQSNSK